MKIGYRFHDYALLEHAMRHSSYANEQKMSKLQNNERLEFLGDAVLELVTSEFLYTKYPEMPEGEATKKRASMVCEQSLALCAKEIDLGSFLFLGKGEEMTGGRERASVTSDALEALIGAIYLDGGFTSAKEFVDRFILNGLEEKQLFFDSKTIFQEMMQSVTSEPIHYELVREEGPDHCKVFSVELYVGERKAGLGSGRTKKAAEQAAAYDAIMQLKK
ncbi:MAG: ribonuclease III [Lachnospiraceae bacterium]